MKTKPLFIVFEGGEGSGKSTQVKLLAEKMRQVGHDVVESKEPGGTPAGLKIRSILLDPAHTQLTAEQEIALFYADRAIHLDQVVKPSLVSGKVVISDRYYFSTWAYQHKGRGLPFEMLSGMHGIVVDTEPDLVILLDIEPTEGLSRKVAQNEITRMEREKLDFHQRVNQGFRDFAAADPDRWLTVDATQTIEEIHDQIWSKVLETIDA